MGATFLASTNVDLKIYYGVFCIYGCRHPDHNVNRKMYLVNLLDKILLPKSSFSDHRLCKSIKFKFTANKIFKVKPNILSLFNEFHSNKGAYFKIFKVNIIQKQ